MVFCAPELAGSTLHRNLIEAELYGAMNNGTGEPLLRLEIVAASTIVHEGERKDVGGSLRPTIATACAEKMCVQ